MLNLKRSVVVACTGLAVLTGGLAYAGNGNQGGSAWGPPIPDISCDQVLDDYFDTLPVNVLDEQTIADIILLREEEKMARDVYYTMSIIYDLSVFPNISWSEQQHMNLVAKLLERYGLPDPAAGMAIGEFEDEWVQETYDWLVDIGSQSLIDALWVGATVEDVDIWHLDHMIEHSADHDFDDVSLIIENMNAGSRNHMRSFYGALEKRDYEYEVQWITEERLNEIVEADMETAIILDEDGEVLAECGLAGGSQR